MGCPVKRCNEAVFEGDDGGGGRKDLLSDKEMTGVYGWSFRSFSDFYFGDLIIVITEFE